MKFDFGREHSAKGRRTASSSSVLTTQQLLTAVAQTVILCVQSPFNTS
jgi:hypothetical protein